MLTAPSDITAIVAWQRPLRQPAAPRVAQQSHTAVCINFNKPPRADSLATVLSVHSELHSCLTILAPLEGLLSSASD